VPADAAQQLFLVRAMRGVVDAAAPLAAQWAAQHRFEALEQAEEEQEQAAA
jgi:hypothetical protein